MTNKEKKLAATVPSSSDNQPIAWALVVVLTMMLIGNNIFNKITLLLFIIYFSFLNIANAKDFLRVFKDAAWLILIIVWAAASILWSVVPEVTTDIVITQVAFFCLCALVGRYAVDKDLAKSLKISVNIILAFVVIYSLLFPSASQSPLGFKAFYPHKNALGIVLAICILVMLYASKPKVYEYVIALMALIFLIFSKSKTSISIVAIVIGITFFIYLFQSFHRHMSKFAQGMVKFFAQGIVPILYLSIAMVVICREFIAGMLIDVLPYQFLTGRGELWLMVLRRTMDHLLTGIGLGSFWQAGPSSEVALTYLAAKAPLWVGLLGAADGGYIDLVGSLGFLGLALLLASYLSNYRKILLFKEQPIVKMIFVLITFFIFHNLTETTIFHSTNSLWFIYIFCSFYLVFLGQKTLPKIAS